MKARIVECRFPVRRLGQLLLREVFWGEPVDATALQLTRRQHADSVLLKAITKDCKLRKTLSRSVWRALSTPHRAGYE